MRAGTGLSKSLQQIYKKDRSAVNDIDEQSFDRRLNYIFGKHKHKEWWAKKTVKSKPVKQDKQLQPVPYYQLFRYLKRSDAPLLIIAVVAALGASSCFPIVNIWLSAMSEVLVNREESLPAKCQPNITSGRNTSTNVTHHPQKIVPRLRDYSIGITGIAVFNFLCAYLFVSIFSRLGEMQVYRIRVRYISALLNQNIGWYDTVEDRNFISRISENIAKIQDAISDKVGLCIYYMFNSLLCLATSLWYGWKLTLVVLSMVPVIAIAMIIITVVQSRLALKEQESYARVGMVAQEVLANIKTVMAFSGQKKEIERFEEKLVSAKRAGMLRGVFSSFGNAFLWFLNYAAYSLGFYYGIMLMLESDECKRPEYGAKEIILVFFGVLTAAFNLGQSLSYNEVFTIGCGAAASIYKVIDRVPDIDSSSTEGLKPSERSGGKIEFKNIKFSYPARRKVKILHHMNLIIQPGTTVALVGNSGCGKSTCLQLLQRLYDPDRGEVLLDDIPIKELNISWFRSQLGVVSQEPMLFNASIAENIRYGKMDATHEEIEQACKLSNAHGFIERLPQKYETMVGERGAQLSGGQKQRIAIARALIRNPPILLLDEATSALDTQSESIVQEALEKASEGRTTIIVAHRLSTIRNADVIVALQGGSVSESGNHNSLLAQQGLYYKLVTAQTAAHTYDEADDDNKSHGDTSVDTPEDNEKIGVSVSAAPEETALQLAKRTSFLSLLKLNKKEWYWMVFGIFFSILQGLNLPVYSYYFGEFTKVFTMSRDKTQERTNELALIFLYIGIYSGGTIFISLSCFALAGEALTNRLRILSFISMMKQDLGWYDNPRNSVGGLCTRLSGDAASVQGATGMRLGIIAQGVTTLIVASVLSLCTSAELGGVATAFVPCILVAAYYNVRLLEIQQIEEKLATEQASSYAFQAVSGIRTVQGLCKQEMFADLYAQALYPPYKKALRNTHILGLVNGFSQFILHFSYMVVYLYGGYLVQEKKVTFDKVFLVAEALLWTMLTLGQTVAFAPNYGKAKVAGGRILNLLEKKSAIDDSPNIGSQITSCEGHISFDNVEFSYPTREDTKILKGLTLDIEPYKHIGICGPSGSGKSTCIQLILRFYDPSSGTVSLDGTDISTFNVHSYRSQIALVSQEPALFDRTMAENIAYGDNSRNVTMDEIIDAAKSANIHSFIVTLPNGYLTKVGDMGAQLSGGQKQRIAIARALVRKPKVLLLDEATSALDTESERVVQEALENVTGGRTCVSIAHRLVSIQRADKIVVIKNGRLIESGTHSELLHKKGLYHMLYFMQNTSS